MSKKKKTKRVAEKLYKLQVSAVQLEHIRDLMSVMLDPQSSSTVSEQIAKYNRRCSCETSLWDLVVAACERADIECGEDVHDYVIAAAPMQLGILCIDPREEEKSQKDGCSCNKGNDAIFSVSEE